MTKFMYILLTLLLAGLVVLHLFGVKGTGPTAVVLLLTGSLYELTHLPRSRKTLEPPQNGIIDSNENQSKLLEISQDCLDDPKIHSRESQFTRSDSNNITAKLAIRQSKSYPRDFW